MHSRMKVRVYGLLLTYVELEHLFLDKIPAKYYASLSDLSDVHKKTKFIQAMVDYATTTKNLIYILMCLSFQAILALLAI